MTDGFTPREREIIELRSEGLTNKATAFSLGLSEQTVKNHITTCLHKTGTQNMVALAVRYTHWKLKLPPAASQVPPAPPTSPAERR